MTLLITLISAVAVTIIWYTNGKARQLKCGLLCYMYCGASLMWLVDAIVAYMESGAEYFIPSVSDMVNDTFLGFSAVALGLVVWAVYVLVKDPLGTVKAELNGKKR
ncbi:MAG: hypothetical protein NC093_09925 [Alistipes sp.]|nr:hypothetical protein [Alistipes sp.]